MTKEDNKMLDWTGERYLPWIESGPIHYEHLHRYAYARQFVRGKKVIDLACGEGYGTALLADDAAYALGIDIDESTIAHAASRYKRDNLEFKSGSIIDIPVKGKGKFNVAICFEAIEHITEHEKLLSEVKRVLRADGLLIISSPNKAVYTDAPDYHNPFHIKELYLDEFEGLLKRYFKNVQVLGQRVYAGSDIWDIGPHKIRSCMEVVVKKDDDDELHFTGKESKEPVYFIALASNSDLNLIRFSSYSRLTDVSDSIYSIYHTQIAGMNSELQNRDAQLAGMNSELQNRDDQVSELITTLRYWDTRRSDLDAVVQAKNAQLVELNKVLQVKDNQIDDLNVLLKARDAQLSEFNVALQTRDAQLTNIQAQMDQINQGIIVQVMSRFRFIIDKLMRPGTKPRNSYELGLTGLRVILNEGWSSFFRQARTRFARKATAPTKLTLPKFNTSISKKEAERLIFPAPSEKPEVSIIIPAYNNCQYTLNCLKSISENTEGDFEVVVVDDCSTDGTKDILSKVKNLRLIRKKHNSGFIGSCNRGAKSSKGKYILFLNNDTMVTGGWLPPMLDLIKREDVGAVGSKLIYPNGKLQEAGGIIWNDGSGWNYGRGDDPDKPEYNFVREVDYCSGACLLLKKELFTKIGGFDERFIPAYFDDADICFSIRDLEHKVIYQPESIVVHLEGMTSGTDISSSIKKFQDINKPKFKDKWNTILQKKHYKPAQDNVFYARDRRSGPRILVIDHYVPQYDMDAGSLRMFNILKILAELGSRVTFIGDNLLGKEPYTHELQQQGIEIIYAPHYLSVEHYIKNNGSFFDVVILSRPHISVKYIDLIKRSCPTCKIIYDTVDMVFVRESRRAQIENNSGLLKEAEDWKRKELYLARKSDLTFVVSPVDKQVLLKQDPSLNIEIISIIQNISEPQKSYSQREDILFIGGFDHLPNVDAVLYFVNDILPLIKKEMPDIHLYVVGSNPPKKILLLQSAEVDVIGYVKDLAPYFEKSRLFIVPVRYGSGISGKILQSMGYGLPVVTTNIGAEGVGLIDGFNALIAGDPKEFAHKVIQLYKDEELWHKISRNSLENIRNNYLYDVIKEKIQNVLYELGQYAIK